LLIAVYPEERPTVSIAQAHMPTTNPIATSLPRDLHLSQPLPAATLTEILGGGQCFRWRRNASGVWLGFSGPLAVEVGQSTPTTLKIGLLAGSANDLRHHLAEDVDWIALADQLPWRTDPHLKRCIDAFPGLRILRQPLGETLLTFICSATKRIEQIARMAEALATRHGPVLHNSGRSPATPSLRGLPAWPMLATLSEPQLRACGLGFRARHVAGVARFLTAHPGWLEETARLDYPTARSRLVTLPGVGPKIADCALLFGCAHLEAFPVDVWILRAMRRHYGLNNWSDSQVAHFGRTHFGPLAGLAQQYLFAWERAQTHVSC